MNTLNATLLSSLGSPALLKPPGVANIAAKVTAARIEEITDRVLKLCCRLLLESSRIRVRTSMGVLSWIVSGLLTGISSVIVAPRMVSDAVVCSRHDQPHLQASGSLES